jgi:hypothetical protein
MGKRSSHKAAAPRRENQVQAAITTLSQHGWDVTMQDGKVGDDATDPEAVSVVRVLLISPWQPKELADHEALGLLANAEVSV